MIDFNFVMYCKYILIIVGMYIFSIYMFLIIENFFVFYDKVFYKKKRKRCVESYENVIFVIFFREIS